MLSYANATSTTNGDDTTPSQLYHVLLVTSHISKNPTNDVEKLRITGSYVALKNANAAAHQAVYDGGYEIEMFKTYDIDRKKLEKEMVEAQEASSGLAVHAKAQDGTDFKVFVHVTPNNLRLTTDEHDGRITADLFYVVQTDVSYNGDDIKLRNHTIESVFTGYPDARKAALTTLLNEKDGITKESFVAWDEAGEKDADCGYGENVLVHAVGENGDNFLVRVLKGEVLESVRLAEAAMRMR